jgi:glutaconyl-CoA decarboxylase
MTYKVTLNAKVYEVEVEKGEAIIVDVAELTAAAPVVAAAPAPAAAPVPAAAPGVAAGEVIAAPLPGTVLEIKVSAGQTVKKGQALFIIEAMKMENEIPAPRDGTIAQIVADKGSAVVTGSPLAVLA